MTFKNSLLLLVGGFLTCGIGCKTVVRPVQTPVGTLNLESPSEAPYITPSPLQAGLYMGRQYETDGNLEEALGVYEGIVTEQGEIPFALHRLAIINIKLGKPEIAKQYFARAVRVDSQNAELLTDYGFLNFETDDLQGAEQNYLAALNVDPNNQRAHNNLGVLLTRTNRVSLARDHFAQAGNGDVTIVANNIKHALADLSAPASGDADVRQVPKPIPTDLGEFRHLKNEYSNGQSEGDKSRTDSVDEQQPAIVQIAYWHDVEEVPLRLIDNPASGSQQ